jgi:putative phosphoesterase
MLIGVISDTHALLRPEALSALRGAEHIIHAGDVGDRVILDALRKIAPLTAIRGNIDRSGPCSHLPATELAQFGDHNIYVLHNLAELDINPTAAGISVVISGHTHQPKIERRKGVLYLNPGSAGPRRFSLPVSLAMLKITSSVIKPELIELVPEPISSTDPI